MIQPTRRHVPVKPNAAGMNWELSISATVEFLDQMDSSLSQTTAIKYKRDGSRSGLYDDSGVKANVTCCRPNQDRGWGVPSVSCLSRARENRQKVGCREKSRVLSLYRGCGCENTVALRNIPHLGLFPDGAGATGGNANAC